MRHTALALLLSALAVVGCGGKPVNLRPAAIASETFATALQTVQGQFVQWGDAGLISRDVEQRWQAAFKTLAQTGLAADAAIRAGDSQNLAVNATAAADLVDRLLRDEVIQLNANQRGAVQTVLTSLRGFIAIWQALQPPASASIGNTATLRLIAEAN